MIIEFNIDKIKSKKVLLPTKDDFPFDIVPSEQTAHYFLEKIALQMDIDYNKIKLIFFDEEQHIIGDNSIQPISIISESNTNYAGAYYGSNESGEYVISLNKAQMNYPENIIATIAHELSHIILSDIKKVEVYDEYLTDLLIVFFGIGVFGANSAFNFFKNFYKWGYNKQGYLNEKEWIYALALFSTIRQELTPEWSKYLKPHIKKELVTSIKFIQSSLPEKWYSS